MANATGAFGLRPVRHINGSSWNGATIKCYVSSNYATALFVGDPVILNQVAANQHASSKYFSVAKSGGADATAVFGVITSIVPNSSDLTQKHIPASTGGYVNVCIDPTVVYQIRDDGGLTPTTSNFIGLNGVIDVTGTGSTYTGLSACELDTDDPPAADQSNPLFVMGLADLPDNEFAINAVWDVIISNHFWARSGAAANEGIILGLAMTS